MSNYDFDIGIIGGGAAGLTVTAGAAQLGAKVLLVEKEPALGGDCLHYGCVPSKTLIRSAHVYHLIKRAQDFGLPQASIAPVDYAQIVSRIRSVIDTIQKHDSVERFCKLGADVRFGSPRFVDEHQIDLDGKKLSAKFWVTASGSTAAVPPFPGLAATGYITNKEIFSLPKLPASMIILGAGPVSIEMAQAFNRLGCEVDVIQRSSQILSREDKDVADIVMQALAAEGVRFHLNASITQVQKQQDRKQVTFCREGQAPVTVEAEEILAALGRTPNTAGLGLERIDVRHDQRGIQVDKRLRTSQSHIFAPGDVNGAFQFTHAAGYEGGIVIANAIFRLPRKADYTYMPWCTYSHPEVASVGMNEKAARAAGIDYAVWTEAFSANDRALAEGESTGKVKMLLNEKEKPIGIQIVGPAAGDIIAEWVAVLNGTVKLATLAGAVHPYPTLAEINKRLAGTYFSGKLFSDTVKKGLKLFFRLKGGTGENPCSKL